MPRKSNQLVLTPADDVFAVPVPKGDMYWAPHSHRDMLAVCHAALKATALQFSQVDYHLSADGQRLYAVHHLVGAYAGGVAYPTFVLRNAYDKSFSCGVGFGEHIFSSGLEYWIPQLFHNRRAFGRAWLTGLHAKLVYLCYNYQRVQAVLSRRVDHLRHRPLSENEVCVTLWRGVEAKLWAPSVATRILALYRKPPPFAMTQDWWSFHQWVLQVFRDCHYYESRYWLDTCRKWQEFSLPQWVLAELRALKQS